MPRPPAGELPTTGAPVSPYTTPPNGMALPTASPAPLSYAGQPLPPGPSAKAAPTPGPRPDPLLEPAPDDELDGIPPEWLIERSPDPWFDQP